VLRVRKGHKALKDQAFKALLGLKGLKVLPDRKALPEHREPLAHREQLEHKVRKAFRVRPEPKERLVLKVPPGLRVFRALKV
jgi:hypothetical protein